MIKYHADFESLRSKDISTVTLPARRVPAAVWEMLQSIQKDLVAEQVWQAIPDNPNPEYVAAQMRRPAAITRHGDVEEYARRRYNRNRYRGQEGVSPRQLYGAPRVSLVFGENEQLLGGVGTVRNTSPSKRLPYVAGVVEQRLKMHSSPSVPILGGHRFEQITDLWFRDESAVVLVGLSAALRNRPRTDHVSLYHTSDPADEEMAWAKDVLDLQQSGTNRYVGSIGEALDCIGSLPGAQDVIASATALEGLPDHWLRGPQR